MTETFNRYGIYEPDHTTFGGFIYPSDFDTNHTSGTIAKRIESDKRFDKQCRKNILNNKKQEEYNNDQRNDET